MGLVEPEHMGMGTVPTGAPDPGMAQWPLPEHAGEGELVGIPKPQLPSARRGQEAGGMGWGEGLLTEQCSPWAQVSPAGAALASPLSPPVRRGHATLGPMAP